MTTLTKKYRSKGLWEDIEAHICVTCLGPEKSSVKMAGYRDYIFECE
jgi:hypothetical protein